MAWWDLLHITFVPKDSGLIQSPLETVSTLTASSVMPGVRFEAVEAILSVHLIRIHWVPCGALLATWAICPTLNSKSRTRGAVGSVWRLALERR